MTITSGRRTGELQALSVHSDCFRFLPGGSGVVLRPNPAFLPPLKEARRLNNSSLVTANLSGHSIHRFGLCILLGLYLSSLG